jgi:iron complex outermembrane receptor protein
VSARKRQETILEVPVVVTALGSEQLDRLQVTAIADLPKLVPGLTLGQALLSVGTQVTIRGIGTSSSDPGIDQSVSLNIDGLALGQGLAFGSGLFDLGQIEVLKGPQALFYGKSSPGGVISLRTADPTDDFEVVARAGYEFEADEGRGELIVSGPINDTLKARLAGMYSRGKGYFNNVAEAVPGTGARDPYDREPRPRNYQLRGTLLWEPSANFTARFKANLVQDRSTHSETFQLTYCPEGVGQPAGIPFAFTAGDDCRLNRDLRLVYLDPAAFPGIPRGGTPFLENNQKYGTLELNYDLSPALSLTSLTAYYHLSSRSLANAPHTTGVGPTIAIWNRFKRRDFTQELRLNSDFEGPVNFTVGAFYQDGHVYDRVTTRGNLALGLPAIAAISTDGRNTVDIETYSLFGQLRWQVLPDVELAGGARWTDETRRQDPVSFLTGVIPVQVDRVHSSNVAPEFTVTYTPTDDLTLFAAYKRAYKSGGFSIATLPVPTVPNWFGDEKVKGGEIGLKSRLFDRQLLLNIAAYDYRFRGLQVGASQPSRNGLPIITTVNAGSARTYGVDFDAAYRPVDIDGLSLNAGINWNRGRYRVLNNVPCWTGQTIALGCNLVPNPVTGLFTAQDLSGSPMIRAPEWQATFGFDYEVPVGGDYAVAVGNNNQFSSKFKTKLATGRPDTFQSSFIKSDVSIALRAPENRWEIALIGKNVTDKITASNCSQANYQGSLALGQLTGGPVSGASGLAEGSCYTERGRSVWIRLTYRPF